MTAPGCQLLSWDTEFFGARIARVDGARLREGDLAPVLAWCDAERVDCLQLLADPNDRATIVAVEGAGFSLVDVRLVFVAGQAGGAREGLAAPIRLARADDALPLEKIAEGCHHDSRFYFDERFDRARVDELYRTWIRKSCSGWAAAVLVLDGGDGPAGYVSCHLDGGVGRIGLVGLAESARGRGMSGRLVDAALDWFRRAGATSVTVATQGRNVRAQRLYQRAGFVTESIGLWYHLWRAPVGDAR